jgi:UrcA family protein
MRVATLFSAAMILGVLSLGARADTPSPSNTTSGGSLVYYGDLNIDTERDARIMIERIEQAAEKACSGHATFGAYAGSLNRTFKECRSETVERTVKQLGAAIVTRIYSEARLRKSRSMRD